MEYIQSSMFASVNPVTVEPEQPKGDVKLAARFRAMADRLAAQIENKRRPMTQNPTPKRMNEYAARLHDGADLEKLQLALYALADMHESGTCPPKLSDLRKKDDIQAMVHTRGDSSGGYYSYRDTGEYSDTSPAARLLQALIADGIDKEAQRQAEIDRLDRKTRLLVGQIPGFFPTPKAIVSRMLDYADIREGMIVLEPSAGSGAIADEIVNWYPDVDLRCIECNYSLRDVLAAKGHNLIAFDFMEYTGQVDRIVQNPPFENLQDIDHVLHAFESLLPDGRLVSVMSESPFFRTDRKATAFREWFDEQGGWYFSLTEDAFKESGTGVKARVVVIDK